jgi:uncharacterized LabA/DUF88 family protein
VADRVALFVDAGFLVAEAGGICCDTKVRADLAVDYDPLIKRLIELAVEDSGERLLRVYWYDAAREGIPIRDHLQVAQLDDVKLRLGRLVHHEGRVEQKGVDSLIIRDLMTLARERAIATAYVVGGDEDLREGVAAAQDMGARVAVIGIEGAVAGTLRMEADRGLTLDAGFLGPFFSLKRAEPDDVVSDVSITRDVGHSFARSCVESLPRQQLGALLTDYPRIPPNLDAQLLREAEAALGSLRERFNLKVELRAAFWEGLSQAVAAPE